MINYLYYEDICLYEILKNSEQIKNKMESAFDDKYVDEKTKEYIKKKLTNVYRIRNNAFVVLLKNEYKCIKKDDSLIMNINGEEFIFNGKAIKTVLQKDYDSVMSKCLDNTESVLEEIEEETPIPSIKDEVPVVKEIEKVETKIDLEVTSKLETDQKLEVAPELNAQPNIQPKIIPEAKIENNDQPEIKVEKLNKEEGVEETPVKEETQYIKENALEGETETNPDIQIEIEKNEDPDNEMKNDDVDIEALIEELRKETKREEYINQDKPEIGGKKKFENNDGTLLSIASRTGEGIQEQGFERIVFDEEDDLVKKYDELIFDIYKIKVKDFKEKEPLTKLIKKKNVNNEDKEEVREIELYVVPLTIPEDGDSLSSDILVIIKDAAGSGYYTSDITGRKSVIASNSDHSFIVTGSWEKGKFKTNVRATGKTLTDKREVSREVYNIRPRFMDKAKLGHPVMFLKEEYINGDIKKLKIHSIPLAIRKNKTDIAPTIYCMDSISDDKRVVYSAKDKDKVLFEFEDEIYRITSMWDGEYFESEIEQIDR